MKHTLRTILSETAAFARDLCSGLLAPNNIVPDHPAAKVTGGLFAAAFAPLAIGAFAVTETGLAILAEVRRRHRLRAPHPESPSLRGTPTDAELADDCAEKPRTLLVRLRLGSRLADLTPTLDAGTDYSTSPTGARRIASRGPGLKGWLADHRIATNYSTLSKYRLLAIRLRALLRLDERLPLEWLLPGATPDRPLPADLRAPCAAARRRLHALLRTHRNFSRLRKHVDAALGIPPMLRARRENPGRSRKARAALPAIPDAALEEATRREILRFLRSTDLSPDSERLRRRAIDWFLAHAPPPTAPENRAGLREIRGIESMR